MSFLKRIQQQRFNNVFVMVYHELTTLRGVYFARLPSQNKPVLAFLIHDRPLRNIVDQPFNMNEVNEIPIQVKRIFVSVDYNQIALPDTSFDLFITIHQPPDIYQVIQPLVFILLLMDSTNIRSVFNLYNSRLYSSQVFCYAIPCRQLWLYTWLYITLYIPCLLKGAVTLVNEREYCVQPSHPAITSWLCKLLRAFLQISGVEFPSSAMLFNRILKTGYEGAFIVCVIYRALPCFIIFNFKFNWTCGNAP